MAVTHAWLSRERQETRENEIPNCQELAKPSKCNLREHIFLLQDAQGQLGLNVRNIYQYIHM